VFQLQHL